MGGNYLHSPAHVSDNYKLALEMLTENGAVFIGAKHKMSLEVSDLLD